MKILVAGGGAFGKEHLNVLGSIGGTRLAVAEPRAEALGQLNRTYSLADSDADAFVLIERFRPDGIIVATPADTHVPLALAALEQGIPVLVEKPVAPDKAGMLLLAEAAARSRGFLQPGHILRFSSAHRLLRDVLESGEIGDLLQFNSRRYRDAGHVGHYADVDPVLMTMIHDIDLALWFSGATAVSADAFRMPAGDGCSVTTAVIRDDSAALWQLSAAWLHPKDCPPDRVEIIGTKGSAELHVGSHIDVYGSASRRIGIDAKEDPLRAELECFLAGIRTGRLLAPVTVEDALAGLAAAELVLLALDR